MRGRGLAKVALALVLSACGPSLGDAYERSFAAGRRAHHAGRYEEAARAYEQAARDAKRVKDRDEALFLVARMHDKRGAHVEAKAALARLASVSPDGPRAARAAFEQAHLEIEHGDAERGWTMLLEATRKYPRNGLARPSVKRMIAHQQERGGDEAVLAWIKGPGRVLRGTEVEENLDYEGALALERMGKLVEARDALLTCARAHPYPFGSLTDDALWRASLIEEQLGNDQAAIAHLRALLAVRESSHMTGSYERPRYSPAQMRIAELYRDKLHDHATARRELHKLYANHPSSILRDDALWAEARLAKEDGDKSDACSLAELLRREFPESRYAACAPLVCDEAKPLPGGKTCADYIAREVRGDEEDAPSDDH
ncbi:tetratricopeptide repeat protein [Polyangium aurulentum]|uniref:tetratricopeptide repeat protein n=1 Tax=Polyangium aurulentum TaxID=2567896 RepID=UPI0010ADF3E3|nr:tetratricopeptide repeat protein [Polyangium aurulentum]UQA59355.1 tetratricopeptide repeat protein [Polyangium aurulentum]